MPAMPDRTHKWRDATCRRCGGEFRALGGNTKWCPKCKPIILEERAKRQKEVQSEKPKEKPTKRNLSVVEAARRCRELGVSYGEAVAKGMI